MSIHNQCSQEYTLVVGAFGANLNGHFARSIENLSDATLARVHITSRDGADLDSATDHTVPGPMVLLPWFDRHPALYGRDTLIHEFGHGAFDQMVQRSASEPLGVYWRALTEHAADVFTVLQDGFYTEPLERQLCVDNHETGVHPTAGSPELCERFFGFTTDPPATGQSSAFCEDTRHLSEYREPLYFQLDSTRTVDVLFEEHQNSCALTETLALDVQRRELGPFNYHGVELRDEVSQLTVKRFSRDMLQTLHPRTALYDYGVARWMAIEACRGGG